MLKKVWKVNKSQKPIKGSNEQGEGGISINNQFLMSKHLDLGLLTIKGYQNC